MVRAAARGTFWNVRTPPSRSPTTPCTPAWLRRMLPWCSDNNNNNNSNDPTAWLHPATHSKLPRSTSNASL
ncbi:hypothetical protein CRUP_008204 [Coryphaenoides rupestris]|nr:hypothetical protein CRUP_008204 [Coryphaenoides rupestris]